FATRFSLSITDDPTSKDISGRTQPRLYRPHCPEEKTTDLEHQFGNTDPELERYLEKEEVPNWIEAPIFLPPVGGGAPHFWGKLSVDNGKECVDVRDVG